jgi:Concanavalin A-like lectin/glucanases superfamily
VFVACASSFTTGVLADGSHTFVVRAFDAVGNPGSDSRTIVVDTTGPTVTIVNKPANPTNSTTGTFTFTVSEGTPTCKLDGGSFMACTSGIAYPSLADGMHTFTVQAMDALGNPGSAMYTWTIDATGPTVTITAPPVSPSTDQTPTTGFTVTGGAVTTSCRIDSLPAVGCAPPSYTSPPLGDGTHSILITATDALGNPGTAAATFVIDNTGPVVTFDSVPPAKWPVNYFTMDFHADEPATFECSLNGAAFSTCTPGLAITTPYNALSSFAVRAKDGLGNQGGSVTTTWTSSNGLVLHYAWEQGSNLNTSLLSQIAAYSPKGSILVPVVGGWAGTATRSPPAHKYSGTKQALSSSPAGVYTAGVWVRPRAGADGLLWSNVNATSTGGHRIRLSGTTVILETFNAAGQLFSTSGTVSLNQWSHVAVRTTGPAKGLELLINGNFIALINPGAQTGFDASQDADLLVGPIFNIDVDDLRFYNIAISGNPTCTTLVRGVFDGQGLCVPMRPGYELDFEDVPLVQSGTLQVSLGQPTTFTTFGSSLGDALRIGASQAGLDLTKYSAAATLPGHSIALWVHANGPADTLLDFTKVCNPLGNFGTCGIAIALTAQKRIAIFAGTTGLANQFNVTVPAQPLSTARPHSIVIAEQKTGAQTTGLKIYIDGRLETTITFASGDIFAIVNDKITMASQNGSGVDEIELWPRDISVDPEMLCENGFDGEFDLANLTCNLTAN